MAVVDIPVALAQIYILVEGAIVGIDARGQIVHGSRLCRTDRRRQCDQNGISGYVPLPVVIEEEEDFVLDDRAPDIAAELVEVVAGLKRGGLAGGEIGGSLQVVDRIVRV